jgi:excinuclease ABC subunit C
MHEMLRRRFRRLVEVNENLDPGQKARTPDESFNSMPDLVIIDGGKGQLGIAVEVLTELGLYGRFPLVGLAKREEEIYRPGISDPLWLKRGSEALHLLQRIRDEAHRFAITYHRNLRQKEQTRSQLDEINGIGPARRKALLTYFGGDVDRIRQATVEEITAVPGMNRRSAELLKSQL